MGYKRSSIFFQDRLDLFLYTPSHDINFYLPIDITPWCKYSFTMYKRATINEILRSLQKYFFGKEQQVSFLFNMGTSLLLLVLLGVGCTVPTFKLFIDPQKRIGDYTCDKNAYYLLIGKVDEARAKYLKSNVEFGIDSEYKAYKAAQKEVLEKADHNSDKYISTEEAYQMHMADAPRRSVKQVRTVKKQ